MRIDELHFVYLIPVIFTPGEARMACTHPVRMVIGGIVPAGNSIDTGDGKAAGTEHLAQAGEGQMTDLGTPGGTATVDGSVVRPSARENQVCQEVDLVPVKELR